jgi:hypothetical protein
MMICRDKEGKMLYDKKAILKAGRNNSVSY